MVFAGKGAVMNPFLPFVGLSLVVHISIIAIAKGRAIFPKALASRALPQDLLKHVSVCVLLLVGMLVFVGAGLIVKTSIVDAHSNIHLAESFLSKMEQHVYSVPEPVQISIR